MKKCLIFGLTLAMLASTLSFALTTKDPVAQDIGIAFGRAQMKIFAFSPTKSDPFKGALPRNLITEPITMAEDAEMFKVLREIGAYIEKKDQSLMSDYNTLMNAYLDIINTLKVNYNVNVKPIGPDLVNIEKMIEPLAVDCWKPAKEMIERLDKKASGWMTSTKTKDALYLLIPFAQFIQGTVEQIFRNFNTLSQETSVKKSLSPLQATSRQL